MAWTGGSLSTKYASAARASLRCTIPTAGLSQPDATAGVPRFSADEITSLPAKRATRALSPQRGEDVAGQRVHIIAVAGAAGGRV